MADVHINNLSHPRKPVMTVKDLAASLGVNFSTAAARPEAQGLRSRQGAYALRLDDQRHQQGGSPALLR